MLLVQEAFGKYTLIDRLGGGGMAEVFKARLAGPAGFEKHLALKLILPHFSDDPEFVRMFIHEATLAARLDHANIVRIVEFDQIDGRYYIAMELVDGKDLRSCLIRSREVDRPVRVAEAVQIGLEIGRALAFAHGELIADAPVVIHRDISPHNVILSRAGEVKITDFGIAKLASAASLTRTGTIKGKLAYMSPEQARGEALDGRSDLFSAGCVLWEMLTGQRLFAGPNELATLDNLRAAPILPPSNHNPRVPAELDAVVLAALERDPQRRIASASEFLRRLEQVLTGLPDVDRSTGLAKLFQALFGDQPVRRSTAVLDPGDPAAEPPADPDGIEPIGPDAPTEVDQRRVADPPRAQPAATRGPFRWWIALLFVLPLAAAFGTMALISWGTQPDPGPAVQPDPEPAPMTDAGPAPAEVARAGAAETPGPVDETEPTSAPPDAGSPAATAAASAPEGVDAGTADPDGGGEAEREVRFGRLSLNAIPWAKVYRGKQLLGTTPLERRRLAAGRHVLTLVNDNLKVRRKVKVRVRPGRLTTEVIDLRPGAP